MITAHAATGETSTAADVSVIVVSWNVRELLLASIASILDDPELRLQVIVVDNASGDGSVAELARRFPEVEIVASTTNLGFGPANNVGLRRARAPRILYLNPDTVVRRGAIECMVETLDSDAAIGLVGPRLVSADGSTQATCARRLPTLRLMLFDALLVYHLPVIGPRIRHRLMTPYDLTVTQEVEAISGAAMLGRTSELVAQGGFDETFRHTGEDVDLCRRIRESGRRIVYATDCEVVHLEGRSGAVAPMRTATNAILSMLPYFERRGGKAHALAYKTIARAIQAPMIVAIGAVKLATGRIGMTQFRDRLTLFSAVWAWRWWQEETETSLDVS